LNPQANQLDGLSHFLSPFWSRKEVDFRNDYLTLLNMIFEAEKQNTVGDQNSNNNSNSLVMA
jgi:hypothetical protein